MNLKISKGKRKTFWRNFKEKETCMLKNFAKKTFAWASFWDLWEGNITWKTYDMADAQEWSYAM